MRSPCFARTDKALDPSEKELNASSRRGEASDSEHGSGLSPKGVST